MAKIHANLAKYPEAITYCEKALKINNLSLDVHYLFAQICEEQGDIESTKKSLKTIIYISPNTVAAYLKLANIYEAERDYKRSKKMQESALKILQNVPKDETIPELGNIKVNDLINQLETKVI
jgi:chemotaxis protein methyltransferase CheR